MPQYMDILKQKSYQILQMPLDVMSNLFELSESEIKEFYKWFLSIKEDRLEYLCEFIFNSSSKYIDESKLDVIESVLKQFVLTRKQSVKEKRGIISKILFQERKFVLDDITMSICYDLGIYLGELIISLDSSIKWQQEIDQRFVDYGQPILFKKEIKLGLSPFRVVRIMAAKIYDGTYIDGGVSNVFSAWKRGYQV